MRSISPSPNRRRVEDLICVMPRFRQMMGRFKINCHGLLRETLSFPTHGPRLHKASCSPSAAPRAFPDSDPPGQIVISSLNSDPLHGASKILIWPSDTWKATVAR